MQQEPQPALSVSGLRLDARAPTLVSEQATNGSSADLGTFMLTGAAFPTPGCWEITARYRDEVLAFAVWVSPSQD